MENAVIDAWKDDKKPLAVEGKHYDLEPVKETIEIIEQVVSRETLPRKSAYMIGNALKYLIRAGVKSSNWQEDVAKAENYLHRARLGSRLEMLFERWVKTNKACALALRLTTKASENTKPLPDIARVKGDFSCAAEKM